MQMAAAGLFVISLCDGIGCIFVALSSLGISFDGCAAESDSDLRRLVHSYFPHLTSFTDVMNLAAEELMKLVVASGKDDIMASC